MVCSGGGEQGWAGDCCSTVFTSRRPSTGSVRFTPTASEGPLFFTEIVKVCPEVPASTELSEEHTSAPRATDQVVSSVSQPVASVGWPEAAAVAVLDTVAGATVEATE